MNSEPKQQINALTATRAVAAVMVFIHHFGGNIFPFSLSHYFFHSGNIAVGYFFVLSGFVLYISYEHTEITYTTYIKRRIARIVPVYLLALLMTIAISAIFYNYNLSSSRSLKEIIFSALFIQSFVPTYPITLNLPGWTISVEMFFYILFPLLISVQKKSFRLFSSMAVLLFLLSQYFHLKYFPQRASLNDNIVDTIFFSPEIHLNQFLIGMIGGHIFNHIKSTAKVYRSLPLALFILIIVLIAYRPPVISYQVGLIAPLFMLFIISIAINNPKALNIRPIVYLGEISYGIYILQLPVYNFLDVMNNKYTHIPPQYFFYYALSALVITATASYHTIELPLRKNIGSFSYYKDEERNATNNAS